MVNIKPSQLVTTAMQISPSLRSPLWVIWWAAHLPNDLPQLGHFGSKIWLVTDRDNEEE